MRRHEAVVSGSEESLEAERGAGGAAWIRAPDGLEADRRVELPQDPRPERLAVHPERLARLERGAEVVRRGSLGGVGGQPESGEAGEGEPRPGAQENERARDRDQLSLSRPWRSSMGFP